MKRTLWIGFAIILALAVAYIIVDQVYAPEHDPQTTDEQLENGSSVQHEAISVRSPQEGEAISSPLLVEGEARGTWFFEATFPIVVVNWDGLIIGEGYAQAQGEWMTEDFVPFTGTVTFTHPDFGERGAVILQKSNPSGLPEHDDAIEIPITFTQ